MQDREEREEAAEEGEAVVYLTPLVRRMEEGVVEKAAEMERRRPAELECLPEVAGEQQVEQEECLVVEAQEARPPIREETGASVGVGERVVRLRWVQAGMVALAVEVARD